MRNFWAAAMLTLCVVQGAGAEPPQGENAVRVERARAALQRRLVDAQEAGAVALKAQTTPSSEAAQSEMRREEPPPPLREDLSTMRCLTLRALGEAAADLGDDPMIRIEAQRNQLIARLPSDLAAQEMDLATSYLVAGLAEEARSIARARRGGEAADIVSFANLMTGEAPPKKRDASACAEFVEFLAHAANVMNGDRPLLDERDIQLLSSLPTPMRNSISEALTPSALALGDQAIIEALRTFLNGEETAAALLLDHSAEGARGESAEAAQAMAVVAAEAGPMQEHALLAMHSMGAESPAIDDDLEDMAAGSAGAARARIERLIAERSLKSGDLARMVRGYAQAAAAAPADAAELASLAGAALSKAFASGSTDDALRAIAAVFEDVGFAAPALDEHAAAAAVQVLVGIGAHKETASFIEARGGTSGERDLGVARALMSAGWFDDAAQLAAAHPRAPEFESLRAGLAAVASPSLASRGSELAQVLSFASPAESFSAPAAGDASAILRYSKRLDEEASFIRERVVR